MCYTLIRSSSTIFNLKFTIIREETWQRGSYSLSTVFTLYNKFFRKKKKKKNSDRKWLLKGQKWNIHFEKRLTVFKPSFEYNWLRLIQWILQIYFVTRLRRRTVYVNLVFVIDHLHVIAISLAIVRLDLERARGRFIKILEMRRVKRTLEMKSRNTTCLISKISHARSDSRLWNASNKINITNGTSLS